MSDLEDVEHSPQDNRPPRNRLRLGFTITIWLVLIAMVVAIFSPLRDVALNHSRRQRSGTQLLPQLPSR